MKDFIGGWGKEKSLKTPSGVHHILGTEQQPLPLQTADSVQETKKCSVTQHLLLAPVPNPRTLELTQFFSTSLTPLLFSFSH